MTLFPLLEKLRLRYLPKLGHFFLTKHPLKFPFLREVWINECPEMKTFVQQGIPVSTPSLREVNYEYVGKVDDLNKWTQQKFTSQEQKSSQGDISEASDDSKG
uniref:Cc-nbs-lrr resistance protein n=1 Tax=Solanum tuberosum TaxID=4113 RepID=M1BMQ4_SOLTU